MKSRIPALIFLALIAVFAGLVYAAGGDGRADLYSDGFRLGSNGTKINLLKAGTVDVNNGATSKTITVTNARPGDIAIVTPNESLGSAAKFYATATTNTLTVAVDADPQTTVTFNYLVIGKP